MVASISREATMKDQAGWSAFFKTKGNLHRLSICIFTGIMSEWVGNCLITFYLAPVLRSIGVHNPRAQASVNLGLQIWNAATSACGALASTRFGRRTLWLSSMSIMLFFFALITCLSGIFIERHLISAGVAVLPMLFLFYAGYNMACSTISVSYTLDILPFYLRSKGVSLFFTVDAAAASLSQYINPLAFNALSWKLYFVYIGCLFAFLGIVYFLFPETKDCLWEEIAVIFDRPKATADSDMIPLRNNSIQTEMEKETRLEV
ncbi:hypothetical protein PISL3812_00898 [Talaromyces islandicus]|uniref:Major facilitator superfamily (MFS) profile domain-containing protein n=1 Tax=Talaromyces islandicus TaxID=28573 RepID=A0A0U1LKR8_TALIS|nr:hypothetical protein PISL3812_00898 [Talaromyces islandicus]